jgi:DNA-directed RNA polymerase subunit N (RpoN/RPB10)
MKLAKPILAEEHRKFSTKNNEFNLPHEVLDELGLKEQ